MSKQSTDRAANLNNRSTCLSSAEQCKEQRNFEADKHSTIQVLDVLHPMGAAVFCLLGSNPHAALWALLAVKSDVKCFISSLLNE